jgi:hypothetical protein
MSDVLKGNGCSVVYSSKRSLRSTEHAQKVLTRVAGGIQTLDLPYTNRKY